MHILPQKKRPRGPGHDGSIRGEIFFLRQPHKFGGGLGELVHAAAGRHGGSRRLFLFNLGDDHLGREKQAGHRCRIL